MKVDYLQNMPSSDATRSYTFTSNEGKRCVAWRRYDGSMLFTAEPEELVDPVVKAIKGGAVGALTEMVKTGRNLTERNKLGWLPLHEAATHGKKECLDILLEAHPEVINRRTMKGQTPLFLAVVAENVSCVQCLLEKGANPIIADKDRETPLYKACEGENVEMVAMLLGFGAGVNKHCIQGWTALHEAVIRNNMEICELLMRAGAKLSPLNMYGITPLFAAAQTGNVEVLNFLITNGADVNSQANDGATPLYEACKNGHEEIVELLLSKKADANKPTKAGLLPIHIAAQRGYDEIVSRLIQVTSKSRVRRSGISPLHLAAEHNKDNTLEVLIEADFDVNAKLSTDRSSIYQDRRTTALYFAVTNSNVDAAAMLLEAGANPNLDIFNPLLVAVKQGCVQMVCLLVEHRADINVKIPTHPTSFPASVMFCMKYLSLLKYLMDNGCDALSCFKCEHGTKPHPPMRNVYKDDLGLCHEEPGVQFCDIISSPSIRHWAGPIIDALLDYVGNVQLCSRLTEHLDSYEAWACIKEKSMPPRSLLQLCRLKIRQRVGVHRLRQISTLPLPGRLVNFLNHEE
ncbi:ankyrin repeat and SOCS box protein 2 isoform X2 [Salmo salar]|uniref:Ankyrin repeat and SOCS box protein 2 isoform X2 n=1 Tax=Salmo salar TaxID=8030 RepID=A0A1S3MBG5_SALSA|nr:ankyrin repeat and SOCS box protein 2-like isoform X2 [Salmo salar]